MGELTSYQGGRPVAVVTGAAGGMGQACSRQLGLRYRLVLADIRADALETDAAALREGGFDVAGVLACDISDPDADKELAALSAKAGPLGALVNTAGVSPTMADGERILTVNFQGTARLLEAFLPLAVSGSVVVCIASIAAGNAPQDPHLEAVLGAPHAVDLLAKLRPIVAAAASASNHPPAGAAYGISKRGVLRLVEDQVSLWAARGARIVSVSPGIIFTPMGRQEAAGPGPVMALLEITPTRRWGTAMDVANAVTFLCSDAASFITGCDLRVDGGAVPVILARGGRRS